MSFISHTHSLVFSSHSPITSHPLKPPPPGRVRVETDGYAIHQGAVVAITPAPIPPTSAQEFVTRALQAGVGVRVENERGEGTRGMSGIGNTGVQGMSTSMQAGGHAVHSTTHVVQRDALRGNTSVDMLVHTMEGGMRLGLTDKVCVSVVCECCVCMWCLGVLHHLCVMCAVVNSNNPPNHHNTLLKHNRNVRLVMQWCCHTSDRGMQQPLQVMGTGGIGCLKQQGDEVRWRRMPACRAQQSQRDWRAGRLGI